MAQTRISPTVWGLLILVSACSAPPGLEAGARIPPSSQPVNLLPLDALLAQAQGGAASDASAAALAARAARLRAQAGAN
jgi:hypothetical protein